MLCCKLVQRNLCSASALCHIVFGFCNKTKKINKIVSSIVRVSTFTILYIDPFLAVGRR